MSTRPILSSGRLWLTWLWALVLSTSVAALDRTIRIISDRASARTLLLVPKETWNESRRTQTLASLREFKEVAEAKWLSPSQLAQETSQAVPAEQWTKLFSEESAWLPWVAEIQFQTPIRNQSAIDGRLAGLKLDSNWKLVLWNETGLRDDIRVLRQLCIFAGTGLILILLLGGAALWLSPSLPAPFWIQSALGGLGSLSLIGILGASAFRAAPLDTRVWCIGLATGFILAGVLAPMIRKRTLRADSSGLPKTK